jgi:hypothetical protein
MYDALGDLSLDLLRAFERRPVSAASPPLPLSWAPRNRPISQQIKRLEEQLARGCSTASIAASN